MHVSIMYRGGAVLAGMGGACMCQSCIGAALCWLAWAELVCVMLGITAFNSIYGATLGLLGGANGFVFVVMAAFHLAGSLLTL